MKELGMLFFDKKIIIIVENRLSSDGQQFHQYEQIEQSHLSPLTEHKKYLSIHVWSKF